jgi:hypothetical protein
MRAPILRPGLAKNDGCASETAFQACVESALVEPSVQETGIVKGVSATCAIHDIDLPRFAEKPLTREIGFCTCVTPTDEGNAQPG